MVMSHEAHAEALGVVEQLLGGILSIPPHLPPSLVSSELEHRHRLLGLKPSDSSSTQEAVDFLFTDVYSFGRSAQEEVIGGLDGLRMQLERGGAMGSGVDARTVVRAIVTSVAYQNPEPKVALVKIGLGRSEDDDWASPPAAVDRPLIFVMLRSEGERLLKFDGLQPSRELPGSWRPTVQEAARGIRGGEDMEMDDHASGLTRQRAGIASGHEDAGQGQASELIDDADDFWAGVDDDDAGASQPRVQGNGSQDEEARRREEEAAEAAYWAAYDQVSGSPTAGAEGEGHVRGGAEGDLSLESVEEEADRKRKRARGLKVLQDQEATSRQGSKRETKEAALREMLKGAWKLATSDDSLTFSEGDFVRLARDAVREAEAEAQGRDAAS